MSTMTLIPGLHLLVRPQASLRVKSKTGHSRKIFGVVLPRRINSVKVVRIRRQLANGSYDLDERLDAVLDDILKDINK
jgi:hypothetical protein